MLNQDQIKLKEIILKKIAVWNIVILYETYPVFTSHACPHRKPYILICKRFLLAVTVAVNFVVVVVVFTVVFGLFLFCFLFQFVIDASIEALILLRFSLRAYGPHGQSLLPVSFAS